GPGAGGRSKGAVARQSHRSGCRPRGPLAAAWHQDETELQKPNSAAPGNHYAAGRMSKPAGGSPVVTSRQSAIRSFRANAIIMILRVLPRASAVRARYHWASALSF